MKKLLFLLVALLTSVGGWAFEVDGITYNVVSAQDLTVEVMGYNSNYEGDLVINGTVTYNGDVYKVVSIRGGYNFSSPFLNCQKLKQIGDLNFCTSIGNYAFSQCSGLTSVGDLSACTSIGEEAFSQCSGLTSVGDLSACTSIGKWAFNACSNLTSIGDLSSCTSIGYGAFLNCSGLTSVGDLSSCTSIGSCAFQYCSGLTSVGDLSACMSIADVAFFGCCNLTSIGDLSSCTSIGGRAFNGCYRLTSIDVSSCTSIGGSAFNGLVTVAISSATPPTLTAVPADAGTTFIVPAAALETYRAAEYWSDIKFQIIADNVLTSYDVNAPVLDGVGASNLTNVMSLKVTGDIDSEDIMFIRNNMVNLHHLDLTNANYKASDAEYASGKRTADNSVGGLYGLLRLRSVKLPTSAKSIECDALYNCSYLTDITIPEGIERIENGGYDNGSAAYRGAFTGCPFTSITLPNSITYIGNYTFYKLGLTSIDLPEGLVEIRDNAFDGCSNLTSVTFGPNLKTIGSQAFQSCSKLSTLNLPTSLVSIGTYAFRLITALTELRIPSSVESIGAAAFYGCSNLRDVYTYVVDPITINTNTFSTYTTATLHIPEQCENTYFRHPQWGQFLNMVTFNEPYSYFYAKNDVVLNEGERFDAVEGGDIDFTGNAGSSITIEGTGDQDLGDMDIYTDNTSSASVIADENLTANRLRFHIPVTANRWHFFCFPFRIALTNIIAPGSYVFRYYDGEQRATGSTGWAELPSGTTYLEAGVGYIFQTNQSGTLKVTVENPDFYWHGNSLTNVLSAYAAQNDQDASWNFVGNPMTNYYDIDDMGYSAPLTIWNGSSYVAYRPGDDNYQLSPFEAFFVQKPGNGNNPTYNKGNRMSYNAAHAAHSKKAKAPHRLEGDSRYLLNLVLSNGTDEDQTRVVFNENTSKNYEMECDAAKFMSSEQVPQLFSVFGETRYAINERPKGEVMLGFMAPAAGSYTLRAERMDTPVAVKDLVTGITHELTNGEYTFESEAGTFENRFVLMAAGGTTTINGIQNNSTETESVYTLDGKLLPNGSASGIHIIRRGNDVQKVIQK